MRLDNQHQTPWQVLVEQSQQPLGLGFSPAVDGLIKYPGRLIETHRKIAMIKCAEFFQIFVACQQTDN